MMFRIRYCFILATFWLFIAGAVAESPFDPKVYAAMSHTFGGLCPEGLCSEFSAIKISGECVNGSSSKGENNTVGKVTQTELKLLNEAVKNTDFKAILMSKAQSCAAQADGSSTEWYFSVDEKTQHVSCTLQVDITKPPFSTFSDVWKKCQ